MCHQFADETTSCLDRIDLRHELPRRLTRPTETGIPSRLCLETLAIGNDGHVRPTLLQGIDRRAAADRVRREPQRQVGGRPREEPPTEHLDSVWPDTGPTGIV